MYSYGPPCLWRAIYFEIEGNGRRFTPGGVSSTLLVLDHPRPPSAVQPSPATTLKFQTNTKMVGSDPDMYCPIFRYSPGNKRSERHNIHRISSAYISISNTTICYTFFKNAWFPNIILTNINKKIECLLSRQSPSILQIKILIWTK